MRGTLYVITISLWDNGCISLRTIRRKPTTVNVAAAKSHLKRPWNFQVLKKRSARNTKPMQVSSQETTNIATDMPSAILWLIVGCLTKILKCCAVARRDTAWIWYKVGLRYTSIVPSWTVSSNSDLRHAYMHTYIHEELNNWELFISLIRSNRAKSDCNHASLTLQ